MDAIPEYTNYLWSGTAIINSKTGKTVTWSTRSKTQHPYAKLKHDSGVWRQVSKQKILSLVYGVEVPKDFYLVPSYTRTFVHRDGRVWLAPTFIAPLGTYASTYISSRGYVACQTETGPISVHQLLALTFLDKDYLTKGLCVMHLDDDKTNFKLSNLKVSTYSENNKAAYDTGVNPSKKQ